MTTQALTTTCAAPFSVFQEPLTKNLCCIGNGLVLSLHQTNFSRECISGEAARRGHDNDRPSVSQLPDLKRIALPYDNVEWTD